MKLLAIFTLSALSATTYADTFIVDANATSFSPSVLNVAPGDFVEFHYVKGYPHTATSGAPCIADGLYFDSSLDSTNPVFVWEVPPGAPAEVPFFCTAHCAMGMTGVINVATASANTYNLQMLHSTGGDFAWLELGSGANSFSFYAEDITNTYQMAFVIEGSIDIEFVKVDGLAVHAITGGPAPTLSLGSVTFDAGYYVFSYDGTPMDSTDYFEYHTPGATAFSSSHHPLWTSIAVGGSDVHWQHRDGQLVYEFTGKEGSFLAVDLNHSSGPSDEECFWYGSVSSTTITLPTEAEQGGATIPSGASSIEAGVLVDSSKPFRIVLTFGEEEVDPLPEDVNGDGVVDIADLLAIIAAWGSTSP